MQTVALEVAFPCGLVATALYTPESVTAHLQSTQFHNVNKQGCSNRKYKELS